MSLNDNLTAIYHFTGNTNDESGNGYNLTNTGATLTTDKNGVANQAYSFNGSSNRMQTGNIPFGNTYVVSAKRDGTASGGGNPVILEHGVTSTNRILVFQNGTTGNIRWIINDGSLSFDQTTGFSPNDNDWHTYIITKVGTSWYLYIDDILISTQNVNVTPTGSTVMYLGRHYTASSYWRGKIDEVRIYSTGISAYEALQLVVGYDTTEDSVNTLKYKLLGYWDLNTDTLDKSGNGNDMTASGGASNTSSGGVGGHGYYSTSSVSQLLETPFTEDFSGGEYSTCGWFYSTGDGVGAYPMCAYSNTGGTSFSPVGAPSFANNQTTVRIALHNSSGSFYAGGNITYPENTWNMLVTRVSGNDNTSSVSMNNGSATSTDTWAGSIKDNELYFGTACATNRFFHGRFAKQAVWNRKLLDEEEELLYNSGNGLLYSELEPTESQGSTSRKNVMIIGGNL